MVRSALHLIPFFCKFQNARFDVIGERVGNGAAFGDELHRGLRIVSLCDEDAGTHCHAAVTSIGAMSINPAAVTDRFERGLCTAYQFLN